MKPLVYHKSRQKKTRKVRAPKLRITKGDRVRVISGAFKGNEGVVLRVYPRKQQIEVEGVNVVTKHQRPRPPDQQGGIIKRTAPIHASNVMLLDPKSGNPTRIRRKKDKDGTVERLSVKSGQPIPRSR